MFSTSPAKPRNERETSEAAMSVIGKPFNALGISQDSSLERTPANITIASIKPMPAPSEVIIALPKFASVPL